MFKTILITVIARFCWLKPGNGLQVVYIWFYLIMHYFDTQSDKALVFFHTFKQGSGEAFCNMVSDTTEYYTVIKCWTYVNAEVAVLCF